MGGAATRWLPISSVSGNDEGWISPELVLQVSPNSGQRIIHWRDHSGRLRVSQRKHGFPDDEFMAALGIQALK